MGARLRRFRRRVYERIPLWMRRNDFELFAAFLCVAAGIPLLTTSAVDATSLDATLPYALVKLWALILSLAPIAIVSGLVMQHRLPMAKATVWLRTEAWGLRALAYMAYIYLVAIWLVNHFSTLPAEALILVFALTCHSRATNRTLKVEDYLVTLGVQTRA